MSKQRFYFPEGASNRQLYVESANCLDRRSDTAAADQGQCNPASGGWKLIRVDEGNPDAMVAECLKRSSICAIAGLTSRRESACAAAGKFCQHVNPAGPQTAEIELCCDKFLKRHLLKENLIAIPDYHRPANPAEVNAALKALSKSNCILSERRRSLEKGHNIERTRHIVAVSRNPGGSLGGIPECCRSTRLTDHVISAARQKDLSSRTCRTSNVSAVAHPENDLNHGHSRGTLGHRSRRNHGEVSTRNTRRASEKQFPERQRRSGKAKHA